MEVGGHDSWVMYGPVFFSKTFSEKFLPLLERYYHTPGTEQFYWENVLIEHLDDTGDRYQPAAGKPDL